METQSPFSVSVFNDMVFWSDTKRGTIQKALKATGKRREVVLKRPGQPLGLKVSTALVSLLLFMNFAFAATRSDCQNKEITWKSGVQQ